MARPAIRARTPTAVPRTAADPSPDPVAAIIIIKATMVDAEPTMIVWVLRPFSPSNLLVTDDEDIIRQHDAEHTDAGMAKPGCAAASARPHSTPSRTEGRTEVVAKRMATTLLLDTPEDTRNVLHPQISSLAMAPMGTAARLLRLSCSAQGDRAVVSLVLALGEETVEMEVTV